MEELHPLSPEERRKQLAQAHASWGADFVKRLRRGPPLLTVLKRVGLGVVAGAELNAALADPGDTALKGEHYDGPFEDELKVEEPAPDEVKPDKIRTEGISL